MKKHLFNLIVILLIAIAVLGSLFFSTTLPNEKKNGFERKWVGAKLELLSEAPNLPVSRICGVSSEHIYFAGDNALWLLKSDFEFKKIDTLFFNLQLNESELKAHSIVVDSPLVYLFSNNSPAVVFGDYTSGKFQVTPTKTSIFTRAVNVSKDISIIRAFDSIQSKQIFQKIDNSTGEVVLQADVIKNQSGMGFPTDGILLFDKTVNKLIYALYYQNKIFCLDTNLNIIYEGKTIDTSNTNLTEIKAVKNIDETKLMPSTPRVIVNKSGFVHEGNLFLVSGLAADNESKADFRDNIVFDIYEINSGLYKGSFHVPKNNQNFLSFSILKNDLLLILSKEGATTYKLSMPKVGED